MEKSSLQHHGVKGMRWGVRRYQNSDGTLTEAGKKRYAKELAKVEAEKKILKNRAKTQAKIDKLNAARRANEEQKEALGLKRPKLAMPKKSVKPEEPKKKTTVDLSDDELEVIVTRLRLEKSYKDLVSELNPQKVSAGKKFLKDTLIPTAEKAAAKFITEYAVGQAKEFIDKKQKKDN